MSILVLGHTGTLGRAVVAELHTRESGVLTLERVVGKRYNHGERAVHYAIERGTGTIINCAGAIPQHGSTPIDMIEANALLPHYIDQENMDNGFPVSRVIHMSTDCVYGRPTGTLPVYRRYTHDRPDPTDFYGHTKVLGEVGTDYWTNVRGSFISPDAGFWKWVADSISRNDKVTGWSRAYWNGCTVEQMATVLVDLALQESPPENIIHVGSRDYTSKWEMLCNIATTMGREDWIHDYANYDYSVQIERVLFPTIQTPFIHDSIGAYYNGLR